MAARPEPERTRRQLGTRGVPRAVREREMVATGRRLFAERGYDDVSVGELAAAVGVSKPMVYAYFGSKRGLYLACVEDATAELMERLERATPADLPPDVRLWHGLVAVLAAVEEAPDAPWLLQPRGGDPGSPAAEGAALAHAAMTRHIAGMLREAAVAGGIDEEVARQATAPLAHALVAAVQAVSALWLADRSEPAERHALRLMNLVWMGLGNLLAGRFWLPPPQPEAERAPAAGPAGGPAGDDELAVALERDRAAALEGALRTLAARVDASRAGDLEAVVEWRLGGRAGGGEDSFRLEIAGGEGRITRAGARPPDAVISLDALDLLRLLAGRASGSALFAAGRLRVSGDFMLAARIPRLLARGR